MVNGVSMDNVEHAFAVQQLRKSGKNAKIVSEFLEDLKIYLNSVVIEQKLKWCTVCCEIHA